MTEPLLDLDPALNQVPERVETIHIMGVCGTAMAAVAGMLKESGYQVTGSDSQVYPPMSDFLTQIGVQTYSGYGADNLAHQPDLVLVGNVISRNNPEAQALAAAGLPYLSMPQALEQFYIASRRSLVITGTHGKTTTSSMLASALHSAGTEPSFMIGGILRQFCSNYRLGTGPFFVVEGDEYDTAFFDKESKFLHYRPEVAVITSLEFDHADIFADLAAIKRMFRKFVRLLPTHGLIIANLDDIHVAEIVREAPCAVQSYGFEPSRDWQLGTIRQVPGATTFCLRFGRTRSEFTIQLPGRHNCLNAAAVVAVMHHLGIEQEAITKGLHDFAGVKRRQEIRGTAGGVTVIDDFAHHPTAVRETLTALKQAYPQSRLIAVFEPRSNTSRRAIFQRDYVSAFDSADLSIIREPASTKPIDPADHFSAAHLAADLAQRGKEALAFDDTEQILAFLATAAQSGDVVAILSNGGFDNIHDRLLQQLAG